MVRYRFVTALIILIVVWFAPQNLVKAQQPLRLTCQDSGKWIPTKRLAAKLSLSLKSQGAEFIEFKPGQAGEHTIEFAPVEGEWDLDIAITDQSGNRIEIKKPLVGILGNPKATLTAESAQKSSYTLLFSIPDRLFGNQLGSGQLQFKITCENSNSGIGNSSSAISNNGSNDGKSPVKIHSGSNGQQLAIDACSLLTSIDKNKSSYFTATVSGTNQNGERVEEQFSSKVNGCLVRTKDYWWSGTAEISLALFVDQDGDGRHEKEMASAKVSTSVPQQQAGSSDFIVDKSNATVTNRKIELTGDVVSNLPNATTKQTTEQLNSGQVNNNQTSAQSTDTPQNSRPPSEPCRDKAEYISQSNYRTVSYEEYFEIFFEVENAGTCTWTPGEHYLGNSNGIAFGAKNRMELPRSVKPGERVHWAIQMVVPESEQFRYGPGTTHKTQWLVMHSGTIIDTPYMHIEVTIDPSAKTSVVIDQPQSNSVEVENRQISGSSSNSSDGRAGTNGTCLDEAKFITQSNYPTVPYNEHFEIFFEVENTGTCTWTPGEYYLGNSNGFAPGAKNRIELSNSVTPGQKVRWSTRMVIPETNLPKYASGTKHRSEWYVMQEGNIIEPQMFIEVTIASTLDTDISERQQKPSHNQASSNSQLDAASTSVSETRGMNISGYCQSFGYRDAIALDRNNAYSWRCRDASGNLHGIDLNHLCQTQHGSNYRAQPRNTNDAFSWECGTNESTPTSNQSVSPPIVREEKPAAAASETRGMNISGYCQSAGHRDAVALDRNNAYSWRCRDTSGNLHGIDLNQLCRIQHGNSYRAEYRNFNDAFSWECVSN